MRLNPRTIHDRHAALAVGHNLQGRKRSHRPAAEDAVIFAADAHAEFRVRPRRHLLDLQKLESFRVVAKTRNFTRAAIELGYSQSSVTTHVKAIERELGIVLFERCRFSRDVVLTEDGRRTLEYANRLLALADETVTAVGSAKSLPSH